MNQLRKKERKKVQKGKKQENFWNKQNKSTNKQLMNKLINKQIRSQVFIGDNYSSHVHVKVCWKV